MALFNVLFDIAARTASFESSMARVESRFKAIGDLAKGAGAAIGIGLSVSTIVDKLEQAVDAGDALYRAVQRIGGSAESLSQLKYAASSAGISFEELTAAISKMQKTVSSATGSQSIFAEIGVDLQKLKTLSPDKQFETIAEAISRLKDPADRAHAAIGVFGRGGADLLPLLTQGAAGVEKLRTEADRLGVTMTGLSSTALHDTKTAVDKMDSAWNSLWTTLAVKMAPALTAVADGLRKAAGGATDVELLQQKLKSLEALLSGGRVNTREIPSIQATITAVKAQLAAAQDAIATSKPPADVANALTDALGFGPSALQEVIIRSARQRNDIDDIVHNFYRGLDESTQTEEERLATKIKDFKGQLQLLVDNSNITPTESNNRLHDFLVANTVPPIEEIRVKYQLILTEQQKTNAAMVDAQHQASVSMANSFEQFFANPMKVGIKGLAEAFLQAIDQMVAKELTLKLFGADSTSGALGGIFQTLFGAFGGGKADGGPLAAGKWYMAGENGPEPIWGGGSGAFAAGYGGASGAVQITFQVDARGATTDAIQMLPGAMKQASDNAVQRVIDLKRRGQL